jgi:hypothetical protein
VFINSTILTQDQSIQLLNLTNFQSNKVFKLIYQASKDGFSGYNFHAKVDGKINTLTIIKSDKYIFGGFTTQDWGGSGVYKYDLNAFLFSLVNPYNISVILNITKPEYAIYAYNYYGPTFGGGHDIYFYGGSNDSVSGYSNLGNSYKLSSNIYNTQSFLTGSYQIAASEIEVYQLDRN